MRSSELALLFYLSGAASASSDIDTQDLPIASFEFFGCAGDWNGDESRPGILRISNAGKTTYLVTHMGSCGSDAARNARATLSNGVLDLSYDAYSSRDIYLACPCEYWVKFSLEGEPKGVKSATFHGQTYPLRGFWPAG